MHRGNGASKWSGILGFFSSSLKGNLIFKMVILRMEAAREKKFSSDGLLCYASLFKAFIQRVHPRY